MLRYDESEFRAVAGAVLRFNPYAQNETIESVVKRMTDIVHDVAEAGYVSTFGFVLTGFNSHADGARCVRASVSASLFD
jgi:pyridoxal/pyridoxine/pyridoxamine kinase